MVAKKSVLIIDDEENPRILIKEYLSYHKDFMVIGECQNGLEAIKYINLYEPDLIFLDIQMPGPNGFQILKEIDHIPQVIFTTAFNQYAANAFEHNAVDYLLKPYTKERFDRALLKINTQASTTGLQNFTESIINYDNYVNRILVEKGKRLKSLDVSEIIYFKAEKDYTQIFTETETFLSIHGIGFIEQKLDPKIFIRIHRSYIVNIKHIAELYRDISKIFIVLSNSLDIAVGRKYIPTIKRMIF